MQIIQPYIQAIQMHSLCPTKNEKKFYTIVMSISFQKWCCYVKVRQNALEDCSIHFHIGMLVGWCMVYWCNFETQQHLMPVVVM